ncbi:polyprenyl synthetase family protein [Hansschlegelia quercus]|uniref:Probable farnesyl diphosphate synthase n=1 Tax=Hansschlegelia quercus TaxID=2528245 RepID=A0A4Q9GB77_9HYPH|nr:farnesyl diphosphate synthase [Hansschlegelia quercus]TBN48277.1 polyprenyl synthetase family protein [Hansschlegelia quercus]
MSGFEALLSETAEAVEVALDSVLSPKPRPGEIARPERLVAAMRHAMLGGGKRLRPALVAASARLFDVTGEEPLMAGLAVECIHGYSLIHDDLPAMDDDDLRRGRPTTHRAFDEATAILAGDALQALAFDLLAQERTHPDPAVRIALVAILARASGLGGMVGGQMLDLAAEGRFGPGGGADEAGVRLIQSMKTGALIAASVAMGGVLGGASATAQEALLRFGESLGFAFQLADDLLDVAGDAASVGKATGKDAAAGKATLVGLMGIDAARARLASLVDEADAALAAFGSEADALREAARFVVLRDR